MWLHEAFKYFRKIIIVLFCDPNTSFSLEKMTEVEVVVYRHPFRALCSEFLVKKADQMESLVYHVKKGIAVPRKQRGTLVLWDTQVDNPVVAEACVSSLIAS